MWTATAQADVRFFYQVLISLACTVFLCYANAAYQNVFDGPLHFECPGNQSISRFHSVHDNYAEDRIFGLTCSNILSSGIPEVQRCSWTAQYVNDWDEVLVFQCPHNSYISGIDSYHNNHAEDRRFKFYCCETVGFHTEACVNTRPLNKLDGPMDYTVPGGKVLRGVVSTHDNHSEDRIWDFDVCSLYEHREETEVVVGK